MNERDVCCILCVNHYLQSLQHAFSNRYVLGSFLLFYSTNLTILKSNFFMKIYDRKKFKFK